MLKTIVNTIAVLVGGCIGLVLKKGLADPLMKALGLCTLFIGITGVMSGKRTLLIIQKTRERPVLAVDRAFPFPFSLRGTLRRVEHYTLTVRLRLLEYVFILMRECE